MSPHEEIEAALDKYQTRSRAATATGAQAFARLLRLAEERNSGQITRVVRFLAATYNGQAFPLGSSCARSMSRSATTCCNAWMRCGGAVPTCTRWSRTGTRVSGP